MSFVLRPSVEYVDENEGIVYVPEFNISFPSATQRNLNTDIWEKLPNGLLTYNFTDLDV